MFNPEQEEIAAITIKIFEIAKDIQGFDMVQVIAA